MGFCVFCGAALVDENACRSCGAFKAGEAWYEPAHETAAVDAGDSGWRPDPTGRHEGRYFVGGQPTDVIRDGGVEALDPIGKQQLAGFGADLTAPAPRRRGGNRRNLWTGVSVALVTAILAGAGIGTYLYLHRVRETPEDRYLASLREKGFSAGFNSDANAVAHGRQVCRKLGEGSPQQGMPADQVAVQNFCPEFATGFHVLETATIHGSFTLNDPDPNAYSRGIEVDGSSCAGTGGYGDVDAGTPVTVKNGKGEILTTSYLEPGRGGRYMCTFGITFDITEGEDRYVVSVGRRGELSYTFADLKAGGVAMELGG
ncbi:DUF732 domain-containing protein [Mycolicibacterium sp. 120266]|uniref:DUF732 domain-containing protein n=1 Tax=Mycolicibacterium sp. 120266 TaxID=3090601 RepID=UPI00299EE90E|nr:DUF732 domain-containing protein [Mycolicibacterium sp. 120266]MDX1874511.1 DUF732 domain-containing protein [Mycolicibacterium sp. 120266]